MNWRMQDQRMRRLQNLAGRAPVSQEAQRQAMAKQRQAAQAKQQQAEQEANEKLTHLAQEQQRKRLEHPAKNPQQAAAQQKEDDQQLALLTVKSYRDVFLPGQFSNALQARNLSPEAEQRVQNLNEALLNDAWWNKQDGAQLSGKIESYSDTLTSLTTGLLGFDLASPPPTPAQLPASRFNDLLVNGAFDQKAATQILREVALAEKLIAGDGLAKAVVDFKSLSAASASSQELQRDPKKLRKEIQASLRQVNTELHRYHVRINSLKRLYYAKDEINITAARYLRKAGG